MTEYIYKIPVRVNSRESNPFLFSLPISISYDLTIMAKDKRCAIGRAIDEAEKRFRKRFPSYTPDVKIEVEKIQILGSKKNKKRLKKRQKEPRLPFRKEEEEKITLLEIRTCRVGNVNVKYKVIEFGDIILFLLSSENPKILIENGKERLIITGYKHRKPVYVRILTENSEELPVLIRWEVENGKLISNIEFIDEYRYYTYSSFIRTNEFFLTKRIAERKLKYLLKKEVKNEKED